jgi:hypothetical protein
MKEPRSAAIQASASYSGITAKIAIPLSLILPPKKLSADTTWTPKPQRVYWS